MRRQFYYLFIYFLSLIQINKNHRLLLSSGKVSNIFYFDKMTFSMCCQIIIILSLYQSFLFMSRNREQTNAPQLTLLQKTHQSFQFGIAFEKPSNFTALYRQHFYSLYLLLLSSYADQHHQQQLISKIDKLLKQLETKLSTHQNLCISGHLEVGCSEKKKIQKNKEALNYLKYDLLQKKSQTVFHSFRNKQKIRSALVLVLSEGENIPLKNLMTLFEFSKTFSQFFGISANFRQFFGFQLIEFESQIFKRRSLEVFVEIDKINSCYRYIRQKNNKALQISITTSLLNSSPFNIQMNLSKQSDASFYNILQFVQDQSYIEGQDISLQNDDDDDSFEQSIVAVPRNKNKDELKHSEEILHQQNEIQLIKKLSSQKVHSHYSQKQTFSMENSKRKKNTSIKNHRQIKSSSLSKLEQSKTKVLKMTDSLILSQEEKKNGERIQQNLNIKLNGKTQAQIGKQINQEQLDQLSSYVYNEFVNEEIILENKWSKMQSSETKADTHMLETRNIFTMVESVIQQDRQYVNYNTEVRQVTPNFNNRILKSLIQKYGNMAKEIQYIFYNKKIGKNEKEKYLKQFITSALSKCNQDQIDQMIKQSKSEKNRLNDLKQITMQESTIDIQNNVDEQLPIQQSFYMKGNIPILKTSDTDPHLSIPNQNTWNTATKNPGIQFKKIPSLYKMNNNKYRIKLEDSVYTGMVDSPKIDRININGNGLSIKKQ